MASRFIVCPIKSIPLGAESYLLLLLIISAVDLICFACSSQFMAFVVHSLLRLNCSEEVGGVPSSPGRWWEEAGRTAVQHTQTKPMAFLPLISSETLFHALGCIFWWRRSGAFSFSLAHIWLVHVIYGIYGE